VPNRDRNEDIDRQPVVTSWPRVILTASHVGPNVVKHELLRRDEAAFDREKQFSRLDSFHRDGRLQPVLHEFTTTRILILHASVGLGHRRAA
jgi:hypothetical protein